MAKFVLLNTRTFAGGADLTSVSNKIELNAEVEEKPATTYGSNGYTEVLGGLKTGSLNAEGYWEALDATKVDNELWSSFGSVVPWTVHPQAATEGSLAWMLNGLDSSYQLGGSVGDVAPWTAEAVSSWPLVRGVSLHNPGTARTTTGNGTSVQHVAVPAGQFLYAALHVLSVSGTATPTLTVTVQSDDATGFASPTTRMTFNAATAVGGQIMRVAGPNTDNWYRVSWTISGTTPSFLFVCSLGVA